MIEPKLEQIPKIHWYCGSPYAGAKCGDIQGKSGDVHHRDSQNRRFWVLGKAQGGWLLTQSHHIRVPSEHLQPQSGSDLVHSYVGHHDEPFVCFAAETMILTGQGERPVQNLKAGDLVQTVDHGLQPLRWIGQRRVSGHGNFAPICFAPGAVGNSRLMRLSPQHRILVSGWRAELLFGSEEVLIAAVHMLNGDTVYRQDFGTIDYVHILFDRHEIVISDGCPTESFHPTEQTITLLDQAAQDEVLTLFPELGWCAEAYGKAARRCLTDRETRAFLG